MRGLPYGIISFSSGLRMHIYSKQLLIITTIAIADFAVKLIGK